MMQINATTRLRSDALAKNLSKKIAELSSNVSAMKSQSSNPSVAPNYYKMVGKLEALESVLSCLKSGRLAEIDNI